MYTKNTTQKINLKIMCIKSFLTPQKVSSRMIKTFVIVIILKFFLVENVPKDNPGDQPDAAAEKDSEHGVRTRQQKNSNMNRNQKRMVRKK